MGHPKMTIVDCNPLTDLIAQVQITGDPYLAAALHPWLTAPEQVDIEQAIFAHRRYPRLFAQAAFTPASLLQRLASETDPVVLTKLAKNPATPDIALRLLAKQKTPSLLRAIASHPKASASLLASIDDRSSTEASYSIRHGLSHNPNTSLLQLMHLVGDATLAEAKGLAKNCNADAAALNALWTRYEDCYLRAEIGCHANCPEHFLAQAVHSAEPLLRRKAATNPNLTQQQATDLLKDEVSQVKVAALRHLDNSNLILVGEPTQRVRRELARQKKLSPELFNQLAHDQDQWVRRWIARHVNCPLHLLIKLATDSESEVRRSVTRNNQTPNDCLKNLATDGNAWVRAGVAYRNDLDLELIDLLADDDSVDVLAGLGRNAKTPAALLAQIASHRDRDVRRSVILNQQTPLAQLKLLSDDPYALNRALLCQHPALDTDSLWLLLEDPVPQVRFCAMQALAKQLLSNYPAH